MRLEGLCRINILPRCSFMATLKKRDSKVALPKSEKRFLNRSTAIGVGIGVLVATTMPAVGSLSDTGQQIQQATNSSTRDNSATTLLSSVTSYLGLSPAYSSSVSYTESVNAQTQANQAANQVISAEVSSCADATQADSLAYAQRMSLDSRQRIALAPVNIDEMFNPSSSNNCFADITKLVDLSIAIPDLSAMGQAALQALRQYATQKACQAVNDATRKAIEPLNKAIDVLNQNGQIDLSGLANGAVQSQLGKIDPELANVYVPPSNGTTVTVFNSNQTTFGVDGTGGTNNQPPLGTTPQPSTNYGQPGSVISTPPTQTTQQPTTESSNSPTSLYRQWFGG